MVTDCVSLCQVPGGSNINNYANVPLIVSLATRVGADAVWPGWGHASEKPALPAALKVTRLNFELFRPSFAPLFLV